MIRRIITFRQKLAIVLQKRIQIQLSPNNMLFGSQGGGRSAKLWAEDMNDYTLPSLTVDKWPHTLLLQDYKEYGKDIFLEENFHKTEYYKNAVSCIREYSAFTWCKKMSEIVIAARYFTEQIHVTATDKRKTKGGHHDLPVIVRKIKNSSMYQVCDGHHRVSRAYFLNKQSVSCFINPWPIIYTPTQEKIISLHGKQELLQELAEVYEVKSWPIKYNVETVIPVIEDCIFQLCQDKVSILDLACSYGAIVKHLSQMSNVNILGVEHRRIAFEIAVDCNKLTNVNILNDSYSSYLKKAEKKFDLVVVNIDRVIESIGKIEASFLKALLKAVNKYLIIYSGNEQYLSEFKEILTAIKHDIKVQYIILMY